MTAGGATPTFFMATNAYSHSQPGSPGVAHDRLKSARRFGCCRSRVTRPAFVFRFGLLFLSFLARSSGGLPSRLCFGRILGCRIATNDEAGEPKNHEKS